MIAAVLTIVLFATPAADTATRVHFARAQKAFAQHDWRRALDEFTAASESAPAELPDLWFDLGQCHRNLGHARQAVAAFERYLALKPDAPDRDKVRALIVTLGGKLPADDPPPPAPPVVAAAEAPAPALAAPPPAAADSALAAAPLPLVPPADAPPAKPHRRWKLWTGVAVGVALVAVGVGLGVGLGTAGGPSAPTPALGSAATFDTRGR